MLEKIEINSSVFRSAQTSTCNAWVTKTWSWRGRTWDLLITSPGLSPQDHAAPQPKVMKFQDVLNKDSYRLFHHWGLLLVFWWIWIVILWNIWFTGYNYFSIIQFLHCNKKYEGKLSKRQNSYKLYWAAQILLKNTAI